jgi:uncharacterized membrane protein YedE/YeeE
VKTVISLLCGLVFGIGLSVSGMTNPAKVLGFLDVFGAWDPTLAFVMGGALVVSASGYAVVRRRDGSWFGDSFAIPTGRDLDRSLLGGATLFGVGWGLVGLCPGPALANLSRGSLDTLLFVVAMVTGVVGYRILTRERPSATPEPTVP